METKDRTSRSHTYQLNSHSRPPLARSIPDQLALARLDHQKHHQHHNMTHCRPQAQLPGHMSRRYEITAVVPSFSNIDVIGSPMGLPSKPSVSNIYKFPSSGGRYVSS